MPLGTNVSARFDPVPVRGDMAITAQLRSQWVTIIDNGGMETQDAATLTDPDTDITGATTHIFVAGGRGSTLLLRMKLDDAVISSTDPVIRVYGRHSSADKWDAIPNSNSTPSITSAIVTTEATDVSDGTDNWTTVTVDTTFPMLGCDEFLVGVQTVLAVSGGDATLVSLEAKVI